jgi:hypothetical protein
MSNLPDWLPATTKLSGVFDKDIAELYEIYSRYFVTNNCFLGPQKVFFDRNVIDGEKEEGFWHLVTRKDSKSGERLYDTRRAERLVWSLPLMENCQSDEVTVFEYMHKQRKRRFVWLRDFDYLMVFQPYKNGKATLLITAYHIDGSSNRRWITRQFDNRIK